MNTFENIKTRRSVRRYTDEVLTKEMLTEIVDVAKMAPTWKNSQTLRYVFVQNEEVIASIMNECLLGFEHNMKTMSGCKNLLVLTQINGICGYEKDGSFSTEKGAGWEMFDAGIAAQTFCLAAHEKGVGTCIMGIFDDKKVADIIGLPKGQSVAALISMGIPKFAPDTTPRRSTEEYISFVE